MKKAFINQYVVLFANGNRMVITASNMSGAEAQVRALRGVSGIYRIYRSGLKAVAPW